VGTGTEPIVAEMVSAVPAPALRPYVARYTGYRQLGLAPAVHRGLPSPYLTVIITLDEPLVVRSHPDPAQPGGRYDTLVGGLHTRPVLIEHEGRESGVQLSLHPLGARRLLGLPAGPLYAVDVPGDVLFGPLAAQLQERIREARTWPQRFAALDQALTRRLARTPSRRAGPPPEVTHAWHLLGASRGTMPVGDLAGEVGWSARHLGERFRTETGLTPKQAARLFRFDRARRLLVINHHERGDAAVADVAVRCGYFDQAHLTREFGALAGCPPVAWLHEEVIDRPIDRSIRER
jgi:AraC-like DNA-binding protein